MIGWKQAAVLTLAVLAAGCSSNSKKELPPAELTKFTEEVVLKKQWSRSIGDGQGETYNTLVPAIENDRIYASDVNGEVFALDRITGDVAWKKTSTCRCRALSVWVTGWSCSVPSKAKSSRWTPAPVKSAGAHA